jgi:hypothetical protein
MSPVGLATKNQYAGEGQQRFHDSKSRETVKYFTVMCPAGLGNKNDCAGEGHAAVYQSVSTVAGSRRSAETRQIEELSTEPLPTNGRLLSASLTALFQLSGVVSHVCLYASSGSTIPPFGS